MNQEISTNLDSESLAREVSSLKIMLGFILKSMGQVDAGKAIINMDRYLNSLDEGSEREAYCQALQQIKRIYLS